MGSRYLTDLADVLRSAGLRVTEQEGWTTRARGSGGFDGDRPWCIMWHHAASAPGASAESVANYASYGCPDAPVCNLVLGRDGSLIVCAAGATNTNGKGGPLELSRGTVPLDAMNTHAISIEAVNTGTGETWPAEQIDAYFAATVAMTAAYGLAPDDLATHEGWVRPSCPGRKIDPATAAAVAGPWRPASCTSSGTWDMGDIRAEAYRRSTPPPRPPEDDSMLYLAQLADGTICVAGSAVRPVSGEELAAGALGPLPRYVPDPASNWHAWLAAAVAEYSGRVMG